MTQVDEAPAEEQTPKLDTEQLLDGWGDLGVQETNVDEVEEAEAEEEATEVESETDEEEEAPVAEEYEEATPPPVADDPGTFTPSDYSFEVEVAGKTTKISNPDEAATFADEHAEDFTAKQLLGFMRKTQKMETALEKEQAEFESRKASWEGQESARQEQEESIENIAKEINYLVSKGLLPKVDESLASADWRDPEVAKKPGVKEQLDLLNYMRVENDTRAKLGLRPLTSAVDAFSAWKLEQNNSQGVETRKKLAADRKAASSRVAGTSPNPTSIAPKGVAVGRVFDLSDL